MLKRVRIALTALLLLAAVGVNAQVTGIAGESP